MFKKSLSLILSFAVFLSSISTLLSINLQQVLAAPGIPTFDVTFTESLTEGTTNGVPKYIMSNINEESALFSFSMVHDPEYNNFNTGTYTLSYPIKDNVLLKMTVEKDNELAATVTYQLVDGSGNPINVTETGSKEDFTIFSYAVGMYENQSEFSSNGTIESGSYVVNETTFNPDDPRDSGGTPDTPLFHITKGTGYSIKYNGVNAHFVWDDITNNFYFFTDSLKNGNIYDVNLDFNGTASESIKVFTGLSLNKGNYQGDGEIDADFIAAPFANDDHFEKDVVYSSEGVRPGDLVNGIRFGFTVPMEWDSSTNSYSKVMSSSDYDMSIKMELGGRQVAINDILSSSLNVTVTGDTSEQYIVDNIEPVDADGKFYFSLTNLPIGVVYENVSIYPSIYEPGTIEQNVEYRVSQNIPFGDVFTFPNFDIIKINTNYYVELVPFTYDSGDPITGTYLLKIDNAPSVTQWSDGTSNVYFPLPIDPDLSAGANYMYQIFFQPLTFFSNINDVSFNDYLHSEKYSHTISENTGGIKMPENFEVVDYSLSETPGVEKDTEMTLSLNLNYDVALKSELEKMVTDSPTGEINVKYSLANYLTPSTSDPDKQTYSYVNLRIYKGSYTTEDGDVLTDVMKVDYTLSYNEDMSDPYKEIVGELLKHKYRADSNTEVYYADFMFDVRASRKDASPDSPNDPPIYFEYPNIYFLTATAEKLDRDGDGIYEEELMGDSNFDSITLNDISNEEVPPPQNIEISNVTEKSFDIDWEISGDSVREYLLSRFTTSQLQDISKNIGSTGGVNNLDAYYNIYIGTDETYLNNKFSSYSLPDSIDDSTPTRIGKSYYIDASSLQEPYKLFVSDYEYTNEDGSTTSYSADKNSSGDDPIETLRDSKGVVMVGHYPIYNSELSTGNYNTDTYTALQQIYDSKVNLEDNLSIYGLDKNKKYYVYADLVIEKAESDSERYVESSKMSPLIGTTTSTDPNKPDDKDKVPPSPVLEVIDSTIDSAQLHWDPVIVKDEDGVESTIEYDIIRLQDVQIEDKYLTTKDTFTYTWDNYLPSNVIDKMGYHTNIKSSSNNILEYDEDSNQFVNTDQAELDPAGIYLDDTGLAPNSVYFYYVRSVRVIEEEDGSQSKSYSNWSRVSATTENIKKPINLTINTAYPDYDAETQMVLNFDGPIVDVNKIGEYYDFYYCIKEDGGKWSDPILMNASALRSGVTAIYEEYTNFNYVVSGLDPGTTYTFKVKMVDKKTGASSLYSNEAKAKTDHDQTDYDNNDEINDWKEYILDKLKDMMNENYWIVDDSSSKRDVVYRQEKFPGIISGTTDSFVTLIPAEGYTTNNYYIPAESYQLLNSKNMGLKVVYKDTEFYMSPKALTTSLNSAMSDVNAENIDDFYIRLSVSGTTGNAINGESALSEAMTFNITTTGFEVPIEKFESDSYNTLISMLSDSEYTEDLLDDVRDYVESGKTDLEIQKLVLTQIPNIEKDLIEEINNMFEDNLSGGRYNNYLQNVDGQVSISLKNVSSDTIANAYNSANGTWTLQNVMNYGSKRTITTSNLGTFEFTNATVNLPGLDGLPYGDNVGDLFVKYGLSEYLGGGDSFSLSSPLTGYMVMGSTARMMGMNELGDPVQFLKSQGVNASERISRSVINSGDMIYYLMSLYENKTNTDIDTVNITNYYATSQMTGLSDSNKKSIQVATQIGLVTDSTFNATYPMTIKDFLFYVNRLDGIVGL